MVAVADLNAHRPSGGTESRAVIERGSGIDSQSRPRPSVTGRTYTTTRPRGFAPWNPQAKTKLLLDEVRLQLDLWDDQQPVTIRQLFYGLIGRQVIDKTEATYSKLCEVLNRARRAGMVPWEAIRDDGPSLHVPRGFASPDEFLLVLRYSAQQYRRDRQAGQDRYIEVWCEAAGMVPQLRRVTEPYGVAVATSGGFDSVTAKYDAACRFIDRDVPTLVLHVGDHDPSGCSIIDSAAEDITAFCDDTDPGIVEFRRLAVTPAQIEDLALPTAPPKAGDRRGEQMTDTVQAEAIPPAVLADIVSHAITSLIDLDAYEQLLDIEAGERAELIAQVGGAS